MRLYALVSIVALSFTALAAHATTTATGVTIQGTAVSANVDSNVKNADDSASVSTLNSSSVATLSASNSLFSVLFNQTLNYPDNQTGGTGDVRFSSVLGSNFSISDSAAVVNGVGDYNSSFDAFLKDLTTGQTLYDSTLGGSFTGKLLRGDSYEFGANATLQAFSDPVLSYNPTISFTPPSAGTSVTPEPSSFALLATGVLGVVGNLRKRFV